jgi:hypothetical protein
MNLFNIVKQYYTPKVKYSLLTGEIIYLIETNVKSFNKKHYAKPDINDYISIGGLYAIPMISITHLFPIAPLVGIPIYLWVNSLEKTIKKIKK